MIAAFISVSQPHDYKMVIEKDMQIPLKSS
jgi:hypothetical protein